MTTYLQNIEVKPHEWARIWAETAPQAKNGKKR